MKKKLLALLLLSVLSMNIFACGGTDSKDADKNTPEKQTEEKEPSEGNDVSDLDALGDVEVDEGLFDVTLVIPATYVGETTQEELDAAAEEYGYKVVLNKDGSATYTMTKKQHEKMLSDLSDEIHTSLSEMVGSEEYPNITDVTANENFTQFTITTKSTELDLNESFSIMGFYMYGGMYNIFSGEDIDNIHVDFVNADSGEIISSSDSSSINQ